MTFYANRNDIQIMFRLITFVMMILFCLCRAIMTLQGIKLGQSAVSDGIIDCVMSFSLLGMMNSISFRITIMADFIIFSLLTTFQSGFAFFALSITFINHLAFFALPTTFQNSLAFFTLKVVFYYGFALFALSIVLLICGLAYFTSIAKSISISRGFIKFRKRFGLFANSAGFQYDLLRHFCFSYKQRCLEPCAPPVGVFGSIYFNVINQESNR